MKFAGLLQEPLIVREGAVQVTLTLKDAPVETVAALLSKMTVTVECDSAEGGKQSE